MISEFKADCTVNLWVEANGNPAKRAWVCALQIDGKRLIVARKFLGIVSGEEAEFSALLFGLRRARRLLQEKVDVLANFPLEGMTEVRKSSGRRGGPDLQSEREEVAQIWSSIRLKRGGKLAPENAAFLAEEAKKAFRRPEPKKRGIS
ncbi:MAG: hypothetical protein AB7K68_05630 [Bacteriovoracia bacterium]